MSPYRGLYSINHENNRIIFSAKETILDQYSTRLPASTPRFFTVFNIYHTIRPDRTIGSPNSQGVETRIATHEFCVSFESFETSEKAKSAVEAMLSSINLPFQLSNHHNQRQVCYDDVSAATSSDDVAGIGGAVDRVSEVGVRIVSEGAGVGLPLEMVVTIRKVTVVSSERYSQMFEASEEDDYYGDMGSGLSVGGDKEKSLFEERYDGEGEKLTCSICIDDVEVGKEISRLPCLHRFHKRCIAKWVLKQRTCPLCRSQF